MGRQPTVAVTFPSWHSAFRGVLADVAVVEPVSGLDDAARASLLRSADCLAVWNWRTELRLGEGRESRARLVQLLSAGADHVPFGDLPPGAILAGNVGAYAEPMAEHILAMTLSSFKRLPQKHAKLAHGIWDQMDMNASLRGSVCGILGYGGIGTATARLMRAFGARIHAVNTSGRTDEPVEFAGTLEDLDRVLAVADVLVIALPLARRTNRLIGRRELGLMKPTATLVNVARGGIVEQEALFEHLRSHPEFTAAIDAWWVEPFSSGSFRLDYPFFELPNVLGSPHNSAHVPGVMEEGARRAAANVLRFLRGEPLTGVVRAEDYVTPGAARGRS